MAGPSARPGLHLTLFVPGLFGPPPPPGSDALGAARLVSEGLTLGALERLLARATAVALPWAEPGPGGESLEGMLFRAFGLEPGVEDEWPVAAVTRAVDAGRSGAASYLRADPVHLRADLREVRLFDASHFPLSLEEARALAGELRAAFAEEGWQIEVPHPARWYVRLAHPPRMRTHPPSRVVGARVEEFLPVGPEARRWRQRLTEIQMILHRSAVNAERERRGQLAVNSVWFWGGGVRPQPRAVPWRTVWADDAVVAGLAQLGGVECRPRPGSAAAWKAALANPPEGTPDRHLIVIDAAYRPSRLADVEGWQSFLCAWHRDWAEPLLRELLAGRLASLTLLPARGAGFRIGRRELRRIWRRPRPFHQWMAQAWQVGA